MRNSIGYILAILALIVLIPACDDSESYADKLKKEKKNIKNFINENNIEVIETYPENSEFKDNQFFYDKTAGVYINVVDTGNGTRAQGTGTLSQVNVRYSAARLLPDTLEYSNNGPAGDAPLTFIYGLSSTYLDASSSYSNGYYFLSPAIAAALKYVGEEGIVKLLIPFTQGSYYQQYVGYSPIYIGRVKYTKIQ